MAGSRRSGLGRGLGALIPALEVDEGAGELAALEPGSLVVRELAVGDVRPNAYQPRTHFDDDALRSLANSIKELGVLQPVLVRATDEGYELIAGERRWRASQLAGLSTIPAIVRDAEDLQSLEQALVENLHRRDLNPIDEAAAYQQLIDDFSFTHEQVARRMGKGRTTVTNLLRLLQLPPKVQRFLIEESLSEGHARALLGAPSAEAQVELAERTVRDRLSVRAVEELVKSAPGLVRRQKPATTSIGSTTAPAALEWQERLTEHLDTRVAVEPGGKRGRIVIEFADLQDLDRVAGILVKGKPVLDLAEVEA